MAGEYAPEEERRRISVEMGATFIGDGPVPPRKALGRVRVVVEKDGSVWANVTELAEWAEDAAPKVAAHLRDVQSKIDAEIHEHFTLADGA